MAVGEEERGIERVRKVAEELSPLGEQLSLIFMIMAICLCVLVIIVHETQSNRLGSVGDDWISLVEEDIYTFYPQFHSQYAQVVRCLRRNAKSIALQFFLVGRNIDPLYIVGDRITASYRKKRVIGRCSRKEDTVLRLQAGDAMKERLVQQFNRCPNSVVIVEEVLDIPAEDMETFSGILDGSLPYIGYYDSTGNYMNGNVKEGIFIFLTTAPALLQQLEESGSPAELVVRTFLKDLWSHRLVHRLNNIIIFN